MDQMTMEDVRQSGEGVSNKIGSAVCGVCIYGWGVVGFAIIVGVVAKLAGFF